MKIKHLTPADGYTFRGVAHFCPACRVLHALPTGTADQRGRKLDWDGDELRPTVRQSVDVVARGFGALVPASRCRYALTAGVILFAAECTHGLAGRRVTLPPLPAYVENFFQEGKRA